MDHSKTYPAGSSWASLDYEPKPLRFGTSGRRGPVIDLTQLEIYINATAELEYLLSLSRVDGGIAKGEEFYYAYDLRPSSTRFVDEQGGRGEIAQAIERAIVDSGLVPVNLGAIPTPALTCYALARGRGSIMVTGSHIPFDRNGYKTNSSKGELLKKDENPINARVDIVRDRLYAQPAAESLFAPNGLFKTGSLDLMPAIDDGRDQYVSRYVDFFSAPSPFQGEGWGEVPKLPDSFPSRFGRGAEEQGGVGSDSLPFREGPGVGSNLTGKRIVVYQHSAVGRDLLVDVLRRFDANVVPAGRSDSFVPIDTENIDDDRLKVIQDLADKAAAQHGPIDAVVSVDGDSDRPLVLGVKDGKVRFFGGDLLGMVVAEYLSIDAVVVPISCNDAIDRGPLREKLQPKTKIGSPFVIEGMQKAEALGKKAVCGWEANGGFLLGSSITKDGRTIDALPTRDAFLPILSVLLSSSEQSVPVTALFDRLPRRFSKASLITNFPREHSLKIVAALSPESATIADARFDGDSLTATDLDGHAVDIGSLPFREGVGSDDASAARLTSIRGDLVKYFSKELGFGAIVGLNYIDGVRMYFDNGDVAHIRPSGNADELRIYAVADSQQRADDIARAGVAEPDGILRKLAAAYA